MTTHKIPIILRKTRCIASFQLFKNSWQLKSWWQFTKFKFEFSKLTQNMMKVLEVTGNAKCCSVMTQEVIPVRIIFELFSVRPKCYFCVSNFFYVKFWMLSFTVKLKVKVWKIRLVQWRTSHKRSKDEIVAFLRQKHQLNQNVVKMLFFLDGGGGVIQNNYWLRNIEMVPKDMNICFE